MSTSENPEPRVPPVAKNPLKSTPHEFSPTTNAQLADLNAQTFSESRRTGDGAAK